MTFNYNSLTDCDGSKVVQLCFSASYSMQNKVYFFDMLSFKIYMVHTIFWLPSLSC